MTSSSSPRKWFFLAIANCKYFVKCVMMLVVSMFVIENHFCVLIEVGECDPIWLIRVLMCMLYQLIIFLYFIYFTFLWSKHLT